MNIAPHLQDLFDAYLVEYGSGYDEDSFVDFVIGQIVKPPGMGYKSLVRYYRKRANEIERHWAQMHKTFRAVGRITRERPLSPSQRNVIRNLFAGLPFDLGVCGGSARGGMNGTLVSLYRRGLISKTNRLTAAGRALAVAEKMPGEK